MLTPTFAQLTNRPSDLRLNKNNEWQRVLDNCSQLADNALILFNSFYASFVKCCIWPAILTNK
ncbi:hypothetical protein KM92DES2_10621 [uncultured Desulfovibrio sp.]|uniref:Uncharacterized protein n=1 Tax=uncultured Desulfovibrio sp. TaxID=167968 RepID=A0A212J6P2_9BACT|nr:hypothetical protein KM92DES2_10621 [uncultured Desulfovibrio sp.]